jgi:hypothetical protein
MGDAPRHATPAEVACDLVTDDDVAAGVARLLLKAYRLTLERRISYVCQAN